MYRLKWLLLPIASVIAFATAPAPAAQADAAASLVVREHFAAPALSLKRIEAKSLRKARRACKKRERFIIPEIKTRSCESWNVEGCFYQIPYRDRGYCNTNFLMDDVFDGSLLYEGHSVIEKGYITPGLWYKMSPGPIYAPIQWGRHKWIKTANLG